jgi:hypothetical protein
MAKYRRKLLSAALVLCVLAFTGCWFDLGEPMPEGQQTQPEGGVFTVKGVENGSHYEVELYDYPDDDDVADAADLKDLMNQFELAAIGLVTLDGENFTADGDFLVVVKEGYE